jgi:hypothetical protein
VDVIGVEGMRPSGFEVIECYSSAFEERRRLSWIFSFDATCFLSIALRIVLDKCEKVQAIE